MVDQNLIHYHSESIDVDSLKEEALKCLHVTNGLKDMVKYSDKDDTTKLKPYLPQKIIINSPESCGYFTACCRLPPGQSQAARSGGTSPPPSSGRTACASPRG